MPSNALYMHICISEMGIIGWGNGLLAVQCCTITSQKLEQLERLRSEDTPHRLMITHTIESYWIPSQKKTKSKLQI